MNNTYVGIDGCKAGWLIALLNDDASLEHILISSLDELEDIPATRVFIDIPLGFATQQYRPCEVAAQQLLGTKKRASVFFTPHQKAVYATAYPEANELNKMYTGKGVSKQAWNICSKIREAVAFISTHSSFPLHEAHPELCFYFLNNRQPLLSKKATSEGAVNRLKLISAIAESYKDIIENTLKTTKRKDVKMDDILDATVLAIRASSSQVQWVPQNGSKDNSGKIYF